MRSCDMELGVDALHRIRFDLQAAAVDRPLLVLPRLCSAPMPRDECLDAVVEGCGVLTL